VWLYARLNNHGPIALPATISDMAKPLMDPKCLLPNSFGHATMLNMLNSPFPIPYATINSPLPAEYFSTVMDSELRMMVTVKIKNNHFIRILSLA